MSGYIGIIIVVAVFLLFANYNSKKRSAEKAADFKRFGENFGLDYKPDRNYGKNTPRVVGKIEGHTVKISEYIQRQEDHMICYMDIKIENSPYPFEFRIKKEGFLNKVARKIGFKDIEFDHKELDDLYRFKSTAEEEFRKILKHDLQMRLIENQEWFNGELVNKKGRLTYRVEMVFTDSNAVHDLKKILDFMLFLMKSKHNVF
jgi:hypothetical protein